MLSRLKNTMDLQYLKRKYLHVIIDRQITYVCETDQMEDFILLILRQFKFSDSEFWCILIQQFLEKSLNSLN